MKKAVQKCAAFFFVASIRDYPRPDVANEAFPHLCVILNLIQDSTPHPSLSSNRFRMTMAPTLTPSFGTYLLYFLPREPSHQHRRTLCLPFDTAQIDRLARRVIAPAVSAKPNETVHVIGDKADVPSPAF